MSERNLYEVTGDIKDINTLLVSREEWNRRAQPAQAGQVLTDDQWQRIADITQSILTRDTRDEIEAVLAKRVPMTPEETDAAMKLLFYPARNRAFIDGIKAAERHHGIVGEKGGA